MLQQFIRKCKLLVFLSFLALSLNAQVWDWSSFVESSSRYFPSIDYISCARVDQIGNTYVIARMLDTLFALNDTFYSPNTFHLLKYSSSGELLWVRKPFKIDTIFNSALPYLETYDMELDLLGNIYMTGVLYGGNIIVGNDTIYGSLGNTFSAFLLKCDTSARPIWIKKPENLNSYGATETFGSKLTISPLGKINVVGKFVGSIRFENDTLTSLTTLYKNIFTASYDSSGSYEWAQSIITRFSGDGNGICSDELGNTYIIGWGQDYVMHGTDTLYPNANSDDNLSFIAKFDLVGNLKWMRNTLNDTDNSTTIDGKIAYFNNSLFTSQVKSGDSIGNSQGGWSDICITRFDTSGNIRWSKNTNFPNSEYSRGFDIDSNSNIYISGFFFKPIPWCNDSIRPFGYNYQNGYYTEHFFLSADSNGTWRWLVTAGSNEWEYFVLNNIEVGPSGEVICTGTINGTAIFDTTYTPNSGDAGFIARLKQPPCCYKQLSQSSQFSICLGDSISFDAGSGYMSYLWSNGDTTQQTYIKEEGWYNVTTKDSTQCLTQFSSVFVDVKPDITISRSIYSPPCKRDTMQLWISDSSLILQQWSTGEITDTILVTQNGQYTAIVTDSNGCTGPTDTVKIVYSEPHAAFTVSDTICVGSPVQFLDSSYNSGIPSLSFAEWHWNFLGPTSTQQPNPIATFSNSGQLSIQLIVRTFDFCFDTATKTIQVNTPPPTPVIQQINNTLFSSSTSNNQWLMDGIPISGANDSIYNFIQNGNYSVVVANECGSDTSNIISITTGIEEWNANSEIGVYPNPFEEHINLYFPTTANFPILVNLYTAQGKLIYQEQYTSSKAGTSVRLPLSSLAAGIYFLDVNGNKTLLVKE